jgi:hypothetical protein
MCFNFISGNPSSDPTTLETHSQSRMSESVNPADSAFITFYLFNKLPIELRLKIWEDALSEPRIIEVEWCQTHEEWFCPTESYVDPSLGVIRANKESWTVYSKVMIPFLKQVRSSSGACIHSDTEISTSPFSHINPSIDTLYIGPTSEAYDVLNQNSVEKLALNPGLDTLRFLACDFVEWHDVLKRLESADMYLIAYFPTVESFTMIIRDMEWIGFGDDHWGRPKGRIGFKDLTEDEDVAYSGWISKIWDSFDGVCVKTEVNQPPKFLIKRITRWGLLMDGEVRGEWES